MNFMLPIELAKACDRRTVVLYFSLQIAATLLKYYFGTILEPWLRVPSVEESDSE